MTEYIATIIGAVIGIIGIIIGSTITFHLTKKNSLIDNKKSAYVQLLTFCTKAAALDKFNKEQFLSEYAEARSLVLLYGNDDVKREYDVFHITVKEKSNEPDYKEHLYAQIDRIASVMKYDLDLDDKTDRKTFKKLRKGEKSHAD